MHPRDRFSYADGSELSRAARGDSVRVNARPGTQVLRTIGYRGGRALTAVFAVALLLRLGAGFAGCGWRDVARGRNLRTAATIAAARGLSLDYSESAVAGGRAGNSLRTSARAPFYPWLLAGFAALGRQVGDDRAFILLIVLQAGVGAALVVPIFRIGRRMFGVQAGIAGAAIAAAYPGFVLAAAALRPTVWQVTGFSIAFLALLRLRHDPTREAAVTCGVVCGLVALTQPAFLWIMAAALAGAIVMTQARRRAVVVAGVLSLMIAVVVVSPCLVQRGAAASPRSPLQTRVATAASRAALFWAPDWALEGPWWHELPYTVLLVFAAGAVVSMRRWLRYYLPAFGAFAAAALIHAIGGGGPQARMPLEPLLFLFSAEGALLPARLAVARHKEHPVSDGD